MRSLLPILLSSGLALLGQEEPPPPPPPPPGLPGTTVQEAIQAGMQSPEEIQYWRAIMNSSTAPSFVVLPISFPGGKRLVCTEVPFLLGAIHTEFGIPYSKEGHRKAISLALQFRNGGLSLRKKKAIRNIPHQYGDVELQWAEKVLCDLSNEDLLNWHKAHEGETLEEHLQRGAPRFEGRASHALAHVLYRRGLSVGRGCVTSNLWIAE